jgi:hypothetical protein
VPGKPVHTVFNVPNTQLIAVIDEAFALGGNPVPNDPGVFIVNMGRPIGTGGQTSIKIVVKPGTSEIITAYPY